MGEMIIMRQDFADALLPHCFHRNTIGEAISLIGAGFVEGKTVEERLMGLRADDDAGIAQNPSGIAGGSLPYRSSLAAEMGEELGQDFLRSNNHRPT